MNTEPMIKAGVGVMIFRDGKVLLGLRKGATASGEYSCPGGKLEHLESFEGCAKREALEECGISIKNVEFLYLANLTKYAPKHFVHIGLKAEWASGEAELLEPLSCESWGWYELDKLPSNIDVTLHMSLESYKTGKKFFDS